MGELKYLWREKRPELVSGLLYSLVRILMATVRLREENVPADLHGKIFCGWHGRSVMFAVRHRKRGFWVIISQSRDGDIQNTIFSRLGYHTIRGSTGRGGARAAVEAIRVLRDGGTMAMTPDGPRGPSGIVQGGVMLMAQKSGAALIPVGLAARPCWRAHSWDRYVIPCPFARGLIIYGDPIYVSAKASPEEVEAIRVHLQDEIHRLEALVEERA